MKTIIINQDAFKKPKWIFGGVVLIFGLINIIHERYTLTPLALLGAYLLLTGSGLEIDPNQMRYRTYKSIAGKRRGAWKALSGYSAIIILVKSGTKTRPGQNLAIQHSQKTEEHQIYFTDKNHKLRLYLKDFPEAEKARKYATEISNRTGLPVERFNPIVSASSRNRR